MDELKFCNICQEQYPKLNQMFFCDQCDNGVCKSCIKQTDYQCPYCRFNHPSQQNCKPKCCYCKTTQKDFSLCETCKDNHLVCNKCSARCERCKKNFHRLGLPHTYGQNSNNANIYPCARKLYGMPLCHDCYMLMFQLNQLLPCVERNFYDNYRPLMIRLNNQYKRKMTTLYNKSVKQAVK